MDFIERLFGISPDGGSGTLEVMVVLVPLIVVAAYVAVRKRFATGSPR
jgi:hypothetical protein